MVGIQNTTQKKFFFASVIFVCAALLLFFPTISFAATTPYTGVNGFINGIAIGVGGFFTGLGGMLFDLAITSLVLQMGDWFINRGLGSVITSIWEMVRDLFNILFIFVLVYIGLRTILDSDDSRTKKMLGMLIAAALLINFSLYIAKVVVDVSNFTAVQVYETATGGIAGTFGIKDLFTSNQGSIAGAYMQVLNVSSWFSPTEGLEINVIVYSVMAMLFLMFLGFVLAYGAIMLTARFVAIIFYLMFSPFMFLGWILPQFQSYATKWWKGFLGYCFFAPVYIFMLYIGLYSLQQIKVGFGEDAKFSDAFTAGGEKSMDTFSVFLLFIIGSGFLVGATKVASMMSSGGAAIWMGLADKVSKKIVGTASGAIYRQTGGRLAGGALAGMDWADRQAAKGEGHVSRMHTLNPLKHVAKIGLGGVREVAGGTTTRGAVESTRNYGAGGRGRKQVEDDMKVQNTRATSANIVANATSTLNNKNATDASKQKAVQELSNADVIAMSKTSSGLVTLKDNAHHLTPEHIKALSEDKEGDRNAIKSIKAGRAETVQERFDSGSKEIKDANADELDSLGFDKLKEPKFAVYLPEDKIDKLKLVASEKEQIKAARKEEIKAIADGSSTSGVTVAELMKFKGTDIAKFPAEALINMATDLNKDILLYMKKNLTQSDQTMIDLRSAILNGGNIRMGTWLHTNPAGIEFGQ